ncbi:uncharacterized protein LOC111263101 [Varroa jacobsoni]|uniref:uncharacterized protein LOC111263101 n=1 Tax=Varroa jacobsoni TaxID=62625 RepID=UPI000BFA6E52|nr:uncharacterized protein LOC111263101 [Varroa jacobsoni]XP_022693644.1 uncharacterized protein LOC111263101 [Varroa jacobsoni]XP_022693645.1 uncharacterized protein LOC111263101 [Varroa jacobsoni]
MKSFWVWTLRTLTCIAFMVVILMRASYANLLAKQFHLVLVNNGYCAAAPNGSKCVTNDARYKPHWRINSIRVIWPEEAERNCSQLRVADLKAIRSDLDKLWPSFVTKTPDELWKNQYNRDISCAIRDGNISTPLAFFKKIIKVCKQWDIYHMLEREEITPNYNVPFPLLNINHALQKHGVADNITVLGVECATDKRNRNIFFGVHLCLDVNLDPARCDSKSVPNPCGKPDQVGYAWYLGEKSAGSSVFWKVSPFTAVVANVLAVLFYRCSLVL